MRTLLFMSLLISLFMLAGCVSYNTDLVNSTGQSTKCAGWAFGWITPVEMIMHHDCMKKAEAAGYHEVGEPQPEPVTAKQSAKSAQTSSGN